LLHISPSFLALSPLLPLICSRALELIDIPQTPLFRLTSSLQVETTPALSEGTCLH
jgi:hypothetical protein